MALDGFFNPRVTYRCFKNSATPFRKYRLDYNMHCRRTVCLIPSDDVTFYVCCTASAMHLENSMGGSVLFSTEQRQSFNLLDEHSGY